MHSCVFLIRGIVSTVRRVCECFAYLVVSDQPSLYLPYTPKANEESPNGSTINAESKHRVDGVLEVQKIEPEAKRSWFLEQTVISGKLTRSS